MAHIKVLISLCALIAVFFGGIGHGLAGGGSPSSHLYTKEITPMAPVECGRCHISIYNIIKDKGAKHQLDCMECHKRFHIYRPGKVEYHQILPRCVDCHKEPHGKEMIQCFDCHAEAHAPAKITEGTLLNESCGVCHLEVGKKIKAKPSRHTDLDCFFCHSEHGLIPECMSCHDAHTKEMTEADCLACHPAHMPLQITYSLDAPHTTCSICHQKAYEDLQTNSTKHTVLTCARCHPEHRQIPQCESCHGKPHKLSIHKGYPQCGDCHNTAHDLPLR